MTTVDVTPYWPEVEDWAGFLLVIVPVGRLPVSGEELCRQVREQVGTDAVLYDLVTVALAPPIGSSPEWGRAFLTSVVDAAMPDRHFFAPRGVIGVVAVADDKEALRVNFDAVRNLPLHAQFWTKLFGAVVRPDARAGVSPAAIDRIASAVDQLVEMYDEDPQVATAEPAFLGRVGELVGRKYVHPAVLQRPADEPVVRPDPPAPADSVRDEPARLEPSRPGPPRAEPARAAQMVPSQAPRYAEPPPAPREEPPPPPVSARAAPPPAAQQTRRLIDPVMYDGHEIVTVDKRTPLQRLARHNETDADCMSELQRDGRPVALVELVFVPDDGVVSRSVTKRRNAIAIELDQVFASVTHDTETGLPAHVAVEVLTATNPVEKHGVLRVAGGLTESQLPKVKIEYFSIAETVRPLLDASERLSRGLAARGVDVVSKHFIFLAAMRFPADEMTKDDWLGLLGDARVTWIDFGVGELDADYPRLRSPFGLHVLTDKEDVLTVIKKQSEVLYRYGRPISEIALPAEQPAVDEPPSEGRNWWPWGKRTAE